MAPETEVQAWLMQNIIPYITKIVKQFYQAFSNGVSTKYLYVGGEGEGEGGGGEGEGGRCSPQLQQLTIHIYTGITQNV